MRWRIAVGAIGVGLMGWGAWGLLLSPHHPAHRLLVLFQVGAAAILHDAVLAPTAVVIGWLLSRLLGRRRARPLLAGLGVSAALVLVAIPLLGKYGAKPDNPSVLPRDYERGLTVVLATVALATLVTLMLAITRARRGSVVRDTE